jgi:two-component system chemotaxis sensor kinase CheA
MGAVAASSVEKLSGGQAVLVIDDSEIARVSMAQVLQEAGYRVITLPSPIGATRAIMKNKVGVVVADVLMPGMRGDRLAALFRSNPRFRRLGVILVSGAADVELHELALEVRADATLQKSRLSELPDLVKKTFERANHA